MCVRVIARLEQCMRSSDGCELPLCVLACVMRDEALGGVLRALGGLSFECRDGCVSARHARKLGQLNSALCWSQLWVIARGVDGLAGELERRGF
eukprot:1531618-Amphidinium_carterae.2